MKRFYKNKLGQFYLLISAILVVIIVGMISLVNYSMSNKNSKVDRFGDEFEREIEKVLDYDSLNNQNQIENFTASYSDYLGNKINASYIYGTNGSLEAYTYIQGSKIDLSSDLTISSGEILFDYDNSTYRFKLEKGQNFYFVFSQDIGGEKYVYTN